MPPRSNYKKKGKSYQKYKKAKSKMSRQVTNKYQKQFLKTKQISTIQTNLTFDAASPNTATVDLQLTTLLSSFPKVADYISMYDRYRILAVKWEFMPAWKNSRVDGVLNPGATAPALTPVGNISIPVLTYSIDKTLTTGGTALTFDEIAQRSNSKVRYFDEPFSIYYKTAIQALETPVAGAPYVAMRTNKQWLECTTNGTANPYAGVHYAIRVLRSVFEPALTGTDEVILPLQYEVIQTVYVDFMRTV